ncbi:hypothetical protein CSHISOI_01596 [Colletotrichum shisoi]|uniref:Uncharacterized protein n=1 Tax=Colletotrichum shisoi TaxID=2078593 RepID=A0A5Q4C3C4_9PEZI|nr:hypothetical protein CSHISOI_01596 [Colletotrichum shisoi]
MTKGMKVGVRLLRDASAATRPEPRLARLT